MHIRAVILHLGVSMTYFFLDRAVLIILKRNTWLCQYISQVRTIGFCKLNLIVGGGKPLFFFFFDIAHELLEAFEIKLDVTFAQKLD